MDKCSVIFPGQSSQYVGMGSELYHEYGFIKELFENAEDILGIPIKDICFEEGEYDLNNTLYTQVAVFLTNISFYKVFRHETGIYPVFMAGHSLGEYAALCCSGAIPFEDALAIIKKRAHLMDICSKKIQGEMWSVNHFPVMQLENLIHQTNNTVTIACYNSVNQATVSGECSEINKFIQELKLENIAVTKLNVSGAFHNSLMAHAANMLYKELTQYPYKQMHTQVISNVYARPYLPYRTGAILAEQITNPVRWGATIQYFQQHGITHIFELGPKETLKKMLRSEKGNMEVWSYDNPEDRRRILDFSTKESDKDVKSEEAVV
ncbi:ACP S-malonyltransferase [Paenibacillus monticola]|uniref:Malonyl CoA-acyl carrier protein transacylase n=1 Tax=Paenibacillus monticola TaxID=2666075 RepID=A0A7X2HBR3_9BACL|nr:ACP S-malonyltransferase [Paenibacillus monticola]MRN57176.1 acyltransferase domain-containing protein [Paenibacillus monticola]